MRTCLLQPVMPIPRSALASGTSVVALPFDRIRDIILDLTALETVSIRMPKSMSKTRLGLYVSGVQATSHDPRIYHMPAEASNPSLRGFRGLLLGPTASAPAVVFGLL